MNAINILVVSHGITIRVLLSHFLLPEVIIYMTEGAKWVFPTPLGNTAISTVRVDIKYDEVNTEIKNPLLLAINDSLHLQNVLQYETY